MATQIPFLPGYSTVPKPKTKFNKTHTWDVQNGMPVDMLQDKGEPGSNQNSDPNQASQMMSGTEEMYTTQANLGATTSTMPSWVAYDRKVLRFYAYFKEAVFSSNVENYRVRKCILYYYLEDDSIHIAEPKVENSGLTQGILVKRHRIPTPDNQSFVSINDLKNGQKLNVYGRNFFLYDCDDFTRQFYDETGHNVGEPGRAPLDPFTKKNTVEQTTFKKLMYPEKEFMEARKGKQMGVDIAATQKFLKNDGRVLRFFCVWHDEKMFGESKPYVVHYFLADDTVEVMEVKQANSGRDGFPAMLKRSKLPKRYTEVAPDLSCIGTNASEKVTYYSEVDMKIGGTINVYGRPLLVCGCDDFTRNFYIDNHGMTEADFPLLEFADGAKQVPTITPPPYNGFGTEEDSLGSFLYLRPKVPKIDFQKLMEKDHIILRFLAEFTNPAPEDKNRKFIIAYYMSKDNISIFEKFERNSGFVGGKFLERARIKDPVTGEYYGTKDLFPGKVIELNHFSFKILFPDGFTQAYMDANPAYFTM